MNDLKYAQPFTIGNEYQGGIIFFIESTGQHGLIAAPFDTDIRSPLLSRTEWMGEGASGLEIGRDFRIQPIFYITAPSMMILHLTYVHRFRLTVIKTGFYCPLMNWMSSTGSNTMYEGLQTPITGVQLWQAAFLDGT